MTRVVLHRLTATVFMLIGLIIGTFLLTHVVPADPARVAAGMQATPQQVAAIRRQLGLDQPLLHQLIIFCKQLAHGDLGSSFIDGRPVTTDIKLFFPATFELVAWSMVLMTLIGVPAGLYSALGRSALAKRVVKLLTYAAMGVPAFVLALLAQILFFGKLGWFPSGNRIGDTAPATITHFYTVDAVLTGRFDLLGSALWHLALPAASLAIYRAGMVARFTESQTMQIMQTNYIRTARAKGVGPLAMIFRHILRNGAAPVITLLGLEFGWLLGGSVLVESIYSWPGMGNYILQSVNGFDFNPVIVCALVLGLAFVVINVVVDMIQLALDPRVRTR
jgi:peptide/nickel transport system permease protein